MSVVITFENTPYFFVSHFLTITLIINYGNWLARKNHFIAQFFPGITLRMAVVSSNELKCLIMINVIMLQHS